MTTKTKDDVLGFIDWHLEACRTAHLLLLVGPVGTEIVRRKEKLSALKVMLVACPYASGEFVDRIRRKVEDAIVGRETEERVRSPFLRSEACGAVRGSSGFFICCLLGNHEGNHVSSDGVTWTQ